MFMILVGINFLPSLVPIEELDGLVVGATEQVRKGRMHGEISDEVVVFVHNFELLASVVVVYSNFRIICAYHDPLLARHELSATHWSIGDLK
jgi:hypothetical protein